MRRSDIPAETRQRERTLTIRDAMPADLPAVVALTLAAYEQYAEVLSASWWEGYRKNVVQTLTEEVPTRCVAAAVGDDLLGSVLYYPGASQRSGRPAIRLLAVTPEARGQGIATALMAEVLRRAHLEGAAALELHTMEVMDVARRMYERMGFVRAPETDFSPVADIQVLGYRLDLAPAGGRGAPA
jgi:GNAT superfamily N-acetyltransferase